MKTVKKLNMHKKSKWLVQNRDGTTETSNFVGEPSPCLKTGTWKSYCFSWSYCSLKSYSKNWTLSLRKVVD